VKTIVSGPVGSVTSTSISIECTPAYCPVARDEVFKQHLFKQIGDSIGRAAGQVVLRWILQKVVVVQTMSTNPINIKDNYDIMDFELSDEQMKQIDELTKTNYRIVDESLVQWCPNWD